MGSFIDTFLNTDKSLFFKPDKMAKKLLMKQINYLKK